MSNIIYELDVDKYLKIKTLEFFRNVLTNPYDCHEMELCNRILPWEIEGFLERLDLKIEFSGENGWQHDCWSHVYYKGDNIMTLSTDRHYGHREYSYDCYDNIPKCFEELYNKLEELDVI